MTTPARCRNWIAQAGAFCGRTATGEDGLCNVCRAAARRGEARRKATEAAYREKIRSQDAAYARRRTQEAAARIVKRDHPEIYAEAEAKALAGDNGH